MSLDAKRTVILDSVKAEIDGRIRLAYPATQEQDSVEATYRAMRYMMFLGDGGKRIRPMLVIGACGACGGTAGDATWELARALEEIHTYTLILDDIQDASPVRRHEATCHIKFGVHTAMLAAMRLYERGLAVVHQEMVGADRLRSRDLLDRLHRGQAADLAADAWSRDAWTLENLRFIHGGKTSSLFQLALLGGAIAAGATDKQKSALYEYGYNLGLAFQGRDDILSGALSTEALGKPGGRGADVGRLTLPYVLGSLDAAQREVERLADAAERALLRAEFANTSELCELTAKAAKAAT